MVSAVITADIVNSTKLPAAAERKLVNNIKSILSSYQFEFFRGDSFQVYLKDASEALRILMLLRTAAIRAEDVETFSSYDIRASIGLGEVKGSVKSLAAAKGPTFVLSGRAFDELYKTDNKLVIRSGQELPDIAFNILCGYIDYIFARLTTKQAAVLMELLQGATQTNAAKKLKKSQATVNKHAQSAGWLTLVSLLEQYDILLKKI